MISAPSSVTRARPGGRRCRAVRRGGNAAALVVCSTSTALPRGELEVQWHAGQVRADYGHPYAARRRCIVAGLLGQPLGRWRPEAEPAGLLPALPERGQRMVVPGRGDQGDAGRQAVIAETGG